MDNESKKTIEQIRAEIPIPERLTLTTKEAAAYSNIGVNLIDALLRSPNCPFALFIGNKKLVKRREFDEFIRQNLVI